MALPVRKSYTGNGVSTTLTSSPSNADTTFTVAAVTGWPATYPFYIVVDPGTSKEEKMKVTGVSTLTVTVTRGQDDTSAVAHSSGAVCYPVFTADEADEANKIASAMTTKGDIITTDGSDINRLGVGTNTHVLQADSTATNGIKWGQVATAGIADNAVTGAKLSDAAEQALNPAGAIIMYGGTTAPTGWLLCYGQAVSRSTYADLFTAIGTTYGSGDGSTTFNVPDIRGRVVAGQDDMGGTSANRLTGQTGGVDGDVLGGTGGAETHTLTSAQMPSHTHTQASHYHNLLMGGSIGNAGAGRELYGDWNAGGSTTANIVPDKRTDAAAWSNPSYTETVTPVINATGGDGAHNNVQPTIILNYIIKT